jgi:membrane protease YdiL (CAAX protease family)
MQTAESVVRPTSSRWQILRSCLVDCLIALGLYTVFWMAPDLLKPYSPLLWQHEDRFEMDTDRRIDEERLARWVTSQPNTSHVQVKHTSEGYQHIVVVYQNRAADDFLNPDWKQLEMWAFNTEQTARPVEGPYEWWDDWEISLAILALGVWRIRRALRDGVPILRPFAGHPLKALAWGVLGGAVFGVLIKYGCQSIPWYPYPRSGVIKGDVLPTASTFVKVAILTRACLLAPVSEEILVRGAFFGRLAAAGYVRFGVLASAVIFAVIHFDVAMLAPAFVAGLVAAILYLRTRSILAPIAFHILWNVMQVTVHIPR